MSILTLGVGAGGGFSVPYTTAVLLASVEQLENLAHSLYPWDRFGVRRPGF